MGCSRVPSALMVLPRVMSRNDTVAVSPKIVVPGSIVRVVGAAAGSVSSPTKTPPLRTHFLSAVKVVSCSRGPVTVQRSPSQVKPDCSGGGSTAGQPASTERANTERGRVAINSWRMTTSWA